MHIITQRIKDIYYTLKRYLRIRVEDRFCIDFVTNEMNFVSGAPAYQQNKVDTKPAPLRHTPLLTHSRLTIQQLS